MDTVGLEIKAGAVPVNLFGVAGIPLGKNYTIQNVGSGEIEVGEFKDGPIAYGPGTNEFADAAARDTYFNDADNSDVLDQYEADIKYLIRVDDENQHRVEYDVGQIARQFGSVFADAATRDTYFNDAANANVLAFFDNNPQLYITVGGQRQNRVNNAWSNIGAGDTHLWVDTDLVLSTFHKVPAGLVMIKTGSNVLYVKSSSGSKLAISEV